MKLIKVKLEECKKVREWEDPALTWIYLSIMTAIKTGVGIEFKYDERTGMKVPFFFSKAKT